MFDNAASYKSLNSDGDSSSLQTWTFTSLYHHYRTLLWFRPLQYLLLLLRYQHLISFRFGNLFFPKYYWISAILWEFPCIGVRAPDGKITLVHWIDMEIHLHLCPLLALRKGSNQRPLLGMAKLFKNFCTFWERISFLSEILALTIASLISDGFANSDFEIFQFSVVEVTFE